MTKALDLDGKLIDENEQKVIIGFDPAYTKDVSVMTTVIVNSNEEIEMYFGAGSILSNWIRGAFENNKRINQMHKYNDGQLSSKPSWTE